MTPYGADAAGAMLQPFVAPDADPLQQGAAAAAAAVGAEGGDADLMMALQMQEQEYYYTWPGPRNSDEPYTPPIPNQVDARRQGRRTLPSSSISSV